MVNSFCGLPLRTGATIVASVEIALAFPYFSLSVYIFAVVGKIAHNWLDEYPQFTELQLIDWICSLSGIVCVMGIVKLIVSGFLLSGARDNDPRLIWSWLVFNGIALVYTSLLALNLLILGTQSSIIEAAVIILLPITSRIYSWVTMLSLYFEIIENMEL